MTESKEFFYIWGLSPRVQHNSQHCPQKAKATQIISKAELKRNQKQKQKWQIWEALGPVGSYEREAEFNRTELLAEHLNQSFSSTHTNPCQWLGPERQALAVRGPGFCSQHQHDGSWPSVTPVSEDKKPPSGLWRHQTHCSIQIDIQTIHIKINKSKHAHTPSCQ